MATTETPEIDGWNGIWEVIGCRWTFHVVRLLDHGTFRFNEILHAIGGVPASTLSTRLKSLEGEGLVERSVLGGSPPAVEYRLTNKGQKLARIVEEISSLDAAGDD